MKTIKKIAIPGATELKPMEMNRIHFETGRHTVVPAATSDPITPAK